MLDLLLRATIESAVLVAAIWCVNRALPRLTPAARATLWWCAAAKFVVALTWWHPIPLPVLPVPESGMNAALHKAAAIEPAAGTAVVAVGVEIVVPPRNSWRLWLLSGWVLGVGATLVPATRRWRRARRALGDSRPASPETLTVAAELAARLRLRKAPHVRMSLEIPTPLVMGLRDPIVLLPAQRFNALSAEQQRMALCHELQHLKRGDLWLGSVPALAERLFFFHPLAHFAAREYVFWRESACDTSVLQTLNVPPHEYGRLLLDLGVSKRPASFAAAAAPWSFTNLKRRILMLGCSSTPSTFLRVLTGCALIAAFTALLPLQLAARRAAVPQAIGPTVEDGTATQAREVEPELPGLVEGAREVEPEEFQPIDQRPGQLNYVLFTDGNEITMSGSSSDVEHARTVRRSTEPMLWFRFDGREYVVRDPALLRQVQTTWAGVMALGNDQGKLGAEQGALGARQGALGGSQGEIGAEQGRIGARQAEIAARQAALAAREWTASTAAERDALTLSRRQIEQQLQALDRDMRGLDVKMREFERPMQELSVQMDALSSRMRLLDGGMQEATTKAEADMRALIERAISSGAAERIR